MNNTQLLAWDSDILGVSVAKIISTKLNQEDLHKSLQKLREMKVKLVYWSIDAHDNISTQAALACGGFLADEKITYLQELATRPFLPFPYQGVEIYTPIMANPELKSIAIEISQLSRFGKDPQLTTAQTSRLYKHWINNACKKIVAKIILVIKEKNLIVGMVVINEKQNRGDLSLIGVNPMYQGQGLGKQLVCAALAWCMNQNYSVCQVVTQKINFKARRLYESCGFFEEKMEFFYHFWL